MEPTHETDENQPPEMADSRENDGGQGVDTAEGANGGVRASSDATGRAESTGSRRERMVWNVERAELVNNTLQIQVLWLEKKPEGGMRDVLRDTLVINPNDDGSPISERQIMEAIAARAREHVIPTYFSAPIEATEPVANIVGRFGTASDLED